jgi:hypothetical protein
MRRREPRTWSTIQCMILRKPALSSTLKDVSRKKRLLFKRVRAETGTPEIAFGLSASS